MRNHFHNKYKCFYLELIKGLFRRDFASAYAFCKIVLLGSYLEPTYFKKLFYPDKYIQKIFHAFQRVNGL